MRARTIGRPVAIAAAAVLALLATTAPAGAVVHPYAVTLIRGRIQLGATFDVPPSPPVLCTGATTLTGSIDDAVPTDNMTATLSVVSPDIPAPILGTGHYVLTATGTTTGTNAGTFYPAFNVFTGLHFPTVTFQVRSINPATCAIGATIWCSGTATVTLSGGLQAGVVLPLTSGQLLYATSTAGQIITRGTCTFPWNTVIVAGAPVSVGANPSASPPDPGAVFQA